MLAAQNSYGAGGTSYGLFDNDKEMALNLGFTGFRRGYDFYKTDWKYLNDPTMRGGLTGTGSVNGLLVPAGSTSVYDQILVKTLNVLSYTLDIVLLKLKTDDTKLGLQVLQAEHKTATLMQWKFNSFLKELYVL
jgi:hypothetical protein